MKEAQVTLDSAKRLALDKYEVADRYRQRLPEGHPRYEVFGRSLSNTRRGNVHWRKGNPTDAAVDTARLVVVGMLLIHGSLQMGSY